jgi:hypothetical protein
MHDDDDYDDDDGNGYDCVATTKIDDADHNDYVIRWYFMHL